MSKQRKDAPPEVMQQITAVMANVGVDLVTIKSSALSSYITPKMNSLWQCLLHVQQANGYLFFKEAGLTQAFSRWVTKRGLMHGNSTQVKSGSPNDISRSTLYRYLKRLKEYDLLISITRGRGNAKTVYRAAVGIAHKNGFVEIPRALFVKVEAWAHDVHAAHDGDEDPNPVLFLGQDPDSVLPANSDPNAIKSQLGGVCSESRTGLTPGLTPRLTPRLTLYGESEHCFAPTECEQLPNKIVERIKGIEISLFSYVEKRNEGTASRPPGFFGRADGETSGTSTHPGVVRSAKTSTPLEMPWDYLDDPELPDHPDTDDWAARSPSATQTGPTPLTTPTGTPTRRSSSPSTLGALASGGDAIPAQDIAHNTADVTDEQYAHNSNFFATFCGHEVLSEDKPMVADNDADKSPEGKTGADMRVDKLTDMLDVVTDGMTAEAGVLADRRRQDAAAFVDSLFPCNPNALFPTQFPGPKFPLISVAGTDRDKASLMVSAMTAAMDDVFGWASPPVFSHSELGWLARRYDALAKLDTAPHIWARVRLAVLEGAAQKKPGKSKKSKGGEDVTSLTRKDVTIWNLFPEKIESWQASDARTSICGIARVSYPPTAFREWMRTWLDLKNALINTVVQEQVDGTALDYELRTRIQTYLAGLEVSGFFPTSEDACAARVETIMLDWRQENKKREDLVRAGRWGWK